MIARYYCDKCGFEDELEFATPPSEVVYPHNTPASWDQQRPEWCKREKCVRLDEVKREG